MKILFLIVGFLATGLSAWKDEFAEPKPIEFGGDLSYRYRYSGHVLTGIPSINDQHSGYKIVSDVVLTRDSYGWIVMQLVNPSLGKFHGSYREDLPVNFDLESNQAFADGLSKPVRFVLENGLFKTLQASRDDPFWSVNIKKSIIDVLQVDLTPKRPIHNSGRESLSFNRPTQKLAQYSTYEMGVKGVCETSYERFRSPNANNPSFEDGIGFFALNITKTRNYRNCLHESTMVRHSFDKVSCASFCSQNLRQSELDAFEETHLPKSGKYAGSEGCSCSNYKPSPVEQYSTALYNLTYDAEVPTIEGIVSEGKVMVDHYGSNFVVRTQLRLSLVNTVPRIELAAFTDHRVTYHSLLYKIWDPVMDTKPFLDIPYYHLFFHTGREGLIQAAKAYLNQISEDIMAGGVQETSRLGYRITRYAEILGYLDSDSLMELFKWVVSDQQYSASTLWSTRRQIFMDLLPYAGTNHAALVIGQLIQNQTVTELEARQLLEGLPKNMYHPSSDVIEYYFALLHKLRSYRNQILSPMAVSWGKLVKNLCANQAYQNRAAQSMDQMFPNLKSTIDQDVFTDPRSARKQSILRHSFNFNCTVEDFRRYANAIHSWMESDEDYTLKLIWGQTLAMMGREYALKLLEPHISGSSSRGFRRFHVSEENLTQNYQEYNFFRASLIYALHHVADDFPQVLKSMMLPIFRNPSESYELRLAAFTVIITSQPDRTELESIASTLKYERNYQVINMVRSIIGNAANLTAPCNQRMAQNAKRILASLPSFEFSGGDFSQANWNEWYSDDKHTGLNVNWQYVANNASQIPRAGYFNWGGSWGPYSSGWFTFAFQQKGFEPLIRRILSKYGLFQQQVKSSTGSFPYEPRHDEAARAKVFLKIFEKTSLFVVDEKLALEAVDQLLEKLQHFQRNLSAGSNFHFVKVLMPSMYQSLVPSDIGLPVHVQKSHPLVISLKVANARIVESSLQNPSINFTAHITPQVWSTSSSVVSTINSGINQAAGAFSIKHTIAALPMRISLGYVPRYNLLTYSFMPEIGNTVFSNRVNVASIQSGVQVDIQPSASPILKQTPIVAMNPYVQWAEYGHPLIGMKLFVKTMSDRPTFGSTPMIWLNKFLNPIPANDISSNGLVLYWIKTFAEQESRFTNTNVQLQQYPENPVQGFYGTLKYNWLYNGDEAHYGWTQNEERRKSSSIENQEHSKAHKLLSHMRNGLSNRVEKWEFEGSSEDSHLNQYEDVISKITNHFVSKNQLKETVQKMLDKTAIFWHRPHATQFVAPKTFTHNLAASMIVYGNNPTMFAGSLALTRTLNHQITWVKGDAFVNASYGVWAEMPKVYSVEAVYRYADYPNEVFWTPSSQQTFAKYGKVAIGWGQDSPVEKIVIHGTMEKVLDTVFNPENFVSAERQASEFGIQGPELSTEPWFEHQCKLDVLNNRQLSPACRKAMEANYHFNKFQLDFYPREIIEENYGNLQLFLGPLVSSYYPWLTEVTPYTSDNFSVSFMLSNQIPHYPVLNAQIITPSHIVNYEKVPAPMSSLPSLYPPFYDQVPFMGKSKTCALSKSSLTTFDNLTYDLPPSFLSACPYVLAMDCSEQSQFQVSIQPSNDHSDVNAILLRIDLDKKVIQLHRKLVPNRETVYRVSIDKVEFDVKYDQAFVLSSENAFNSLRVWKEPVENGLESIAIIEIPTKGIRIVFNGERLVKFETDLRYVGKTCGLCGNSDHETQLELEGPNRCIYEQVEDFIDSYTINCPRKGQLKGWVRCPGRKDSWLNELKTSQREVTPLIRKTLVINKNGKKCFSVRPVPQCPLGYSPKKSEKRSLKFFCLDMQDPLAESYEIETRIRNLLMLYNQQGVPTQVDVPVRCAAKVK